MSTNYLKLILILLAAQFAFTAPAHACDLNGMSFSLEYTEDAIDDLPAPADRDDAFFLGEITVEEKTSWFFSKSDAFPEYRARVHESETHPQLIGKRLKVSAYDKSTCNPGFEPGKRITATGGIEPTGRTGLELKLYSHAYDDPEA